MLFQLAWKNIWRNKKRSLIIILATAFGLWGGLFSDAVMMGMSESSVETAINLDLAHLQIHKPGFAEEKDIRDFIPNSAQVLSQLKDNPAIEAISPRMIIQGIASSPSSSFPTQITAVKPELERKVTALVQRRIAGDYLGGTRRNPAFIGKKLAKRLNLKLHSKFVLSFQDMHGDIVYMSCRVNGIFKSASSQFDQTHIFIRQSDVMRILNLEAPLVHEITIRLHNSKLVKPTTAALKKKFPSLKVESWDELAPELAYINEMMLMYSYLFVFIILLALLFGITNTMLMSVVDRIREFGVLIAIGMKKGRTFSLIILETILLSLSGGVVGIILGFGTISLFAKIGIDLSFIAQSMESFGAESILYPTLPFELYVILTIMIVVTANIAAIFPAWKATHLLPAEAVRSYG